MTAVKDSTIAVRVDEQTAQKFADKCKQVHGKNSSDMIREFVKAFNEDRLMIEQTEAEKGLYKNEFRN
mgnify:CR=1 FL=1